MIHTEATLGPNIGIITATLEVAHNAHAPHVEITAINPAVTHHTNHITDHPHMEVLQLTTPEITVDHTHDHPTNLQGTTCTDHIHIPGDHEANHTSRRTRVKIEDPHIDYYSSDEHSSDSGEEANHLN